MSLRSALSRVACWKYWDVVAFVAGSIPPVLLLIAYYGGKHLSRLSGPVVLAAVPLYLLSATLAWRRGDGRLIAGGCAMLMIALILMLPVILASAFLLATCFTGDCV
ncbi:hypothetical protein [Sphingopyxis sp.]|uniref:hypothetical protein n=1 Tax=Sphingopyxis sp. TaxID=1908224 RepID=UPI001D431B1D|nr:hypothetical protein [Sphingopyxis sp.]MBW8296464.1 hypothetical protein [Sphingopyxis sp.]